MWFYAPAVAHPAPQPPTMSELRELAELVLSHTYRGAHVPLPATAIHAQLVAEQFGGAAGWEAMTRDLDTIKEEDQ